MPFQFRFDLRGFIGFSRSKLRHLNQLTEFRKFAFLVGQDLVISKRGKPVARVVAEKPPMPWLALRGSGGYTGDPFAPALAEIEIDALK